MTCADLARQLVDSFYDCVTQRGMTPQLTHNANVATLATFLEEEHRLLTDPRVVDSPNMEHWHATLAKAHSKLCTIGELAVAPYA